MTKKGEGRGDGLPSQYRYASALDKSADVDRSVNSRVIRYGIEMMGWPEVEWSDPESVKGRFMDYLELCDKYEIRPMLAGFATALGIGLEGLSRILGRRDGMEDYQGLTSEGWQALKKCYDFLHSSLETYLVEENGNPVKWFFLGKNYFGYEDRKVTVHHIDSNAGLLSTPDEIAQRYRIMADVQREALGEGDGVYDGD